ncbi:hypothetical protein NKR19_g1955 [Coniochaeta hoffmannii]|uniref:Uncharacterized protein n=1 Tax=Coniochaeta hoffmannii TaxID=91930 RepID=A0AA38SBD3_9PEZI|nr:hypothetical protein NKR19_g1955 [Coniochaeta hoffmannii]
MPSFIIFVTALCATLAGVQGSAINRDPTADQPSLAIRAVDPSYYETREFKKWVPTIDLSPECPGRKFYEQTLLPDITPAPEMFKVRQCFQRPIYYIKKDAKFLLDDTCKGEGYFNVTWDEGFDKPDQESDTFRTLEVTKCVERPKDCWGQWITAPRWDYEWVIQIPLAIHNKYNKGGGCGQVFHEAVRDACMHPMGFETVRYKCEQTWNGIELRFRHDLLCGRTRIQNALKAASNGELDYQCPYFVEVPIVKYYRSED